MLRLSLGMTNFLPALVLLFSLFLPVIPSVARDQRGAIFLSHPLPQIGGGLPAPFDRDRGARY
jgi:hypothetical protein